MRGRPFRLPRLAPVLFPVLPFFALSLVALPGGPGEGPPPPAARALPDERIEAFRADLVALRERLGIPGLSVAVAVDGEVAWAGGLGWADVEARRPATPETPYRIASITKTMTAAVVLGLAAEGKLDLDAPVSRYLGTEPGEDREAPRPGAVGEADEEGPAGGGPSGPDRAWTRRATVRQLLGHTSEGPRPGEIYVYSGRYDVLAGVAAGAAGRPFPGLLFERVIRPAGLSRTVPVSLADTERGAEVLADLATPYGADGAPADVRGMLPPETFGGNGVVSTVLDLVRFVDALEDGRLGGSEVPEAMWTPGRTSDGEALPYGMGWFVERTPTLELVHHGGQWPVYSGLLLHVRPRSDDEGPRPDDVRPRPDDEGIRSDAATGAGPAASTYTLALLANSAALSRPYWVIGTGTVLHSAAAASFLRRFALDDVWPGPAPEVPWEAAADALEARGRTLKGAAARYHYGAEVLGRGLTARAAGAPARADSLLRAAVACCPAALEASSDLGLLFHLGRSDDPELRRRGREAGRRRLARAPGDPLALFHLAVSHARGEEGERAVPLLESLVADGEGGGAAARGAGWDDVPAWMWGWSAYLLAEEIAGEDRRRAISLLERVLERGVDEGGLLRETRALLRELR